MREFALRFLKKALANPAADFRAGQWECIEGILKIQRQLVVQKTGLSKSRLTCFVIAGLNGAGKTTFAMRYLPLADYAAVGTTREPCLDAYASRTSEGWLCLIAKSGTASRSINHEESLIVGARSEDRARFRKWWPTPSRSTGKPASRS